MGKPQSTRQRKARRRVVVLLVLCCAVFALFLARLAWLQFAMADHYAQKMAEASSASYTLPQHMTRSTITDRTGTVLARDETVYDVYPRIPSPPGTNLRKTVNIIETLTGGNNLVMPRQTTRRSPWPWCWNMAAVPMPRPFCGLYWMPSLDYLK